MVWREINGERVKCKFNDILSYSGIYLDDKFSLEKVDIVKLKNVVKELIKNRFNTKLELDDYKLFITNTSKGFLLNAVRQRTYLSTEENITDISVFLGLICAEVSYLTNELFEIGEISNQAVFLYGEPQSNTYRKINFKEYKLIENYDLTDF